MTPVTDALRALVACPVCKGPLAPADDALECTACRVAYPVVDGIPVLLAGRARPLDR